MQQLEGRINNQITGVKDLNVRDRYAAEAREEHVTELDNVLQIMVLSKSRPANISEKKRSLKQSSRLRKKIHNSNVYFNIVTFAIYGKNNGNMVVGKIPEFFQFPKRDICISTAHCKCTIYIFTYKSIKVVIRCFYFKNFIGYKFSINIF